MACSRPFSSRSTPDRPASTPAVFEVERAWRSKMTVMSRLPSR
ncbi:Uncharacterised protein [Mycobacterium tuberculosis]|nr:Uncharacterised protein [Mycobacterium tuberculosis]